MEVFTMINVNRFYALCACISLITTNMSLVTVPQARTVQKKQARKTTKNKKQLRKKRPVSKKRRATGKKKSIKKTVKSNPAIARSARQVLPIITQVPVRAEINIQYQQELIAHQATCNALTQEKIENKKLSDQIELLRIHAKNTKNTVQNNQIKQLENAHQEAIARIHKEYQEIIDKNKKDNMPKTAPLIQAQVTTQAATQTDAIQAHTTQAHKITPQISPVVKPVVGASMSTQTSTSPVATATTATTQTEEYRIPPTPAVQSAVLIYETEIAKLKAIISTYKQEEKTKPTTSFPVTSFSAIIPEAAQPITTQEEEEEEEEEEMPELIALVEDNPGLAKNSPTQQPGPIFTFDKNKRILRKI